MLATILGRSAGPIGRSRGCELLLKVVVGDAEVQGVDGPRRDSSAGARAIVVSLPGLAATAHVTVPADRPPHRTALEHSQHAAWFDHAVQAARNPIRDGQQLLAGRTLADAVAEFRRRDRTSRLASRKAPGRSWPRRVRGWRLASAEQGDWWLTKGGEWYLWDGHRLDASGDPPASCTTDILARMGDVLGVVSTPG
jgi:hypothetical protein